MNHVQATQRTCWDRRLAMCFKIARGIVEGPSNMNRLDTIQARLDSTWRATLSIQVALANFEAELNDAQKNRFDAMNFAARESAQPVQRDAGSGRLNAR